MGLHPGRGGAGGEQSADLRALSRSQTNEVLLARHGGLLRW